MRNKLSNQELFKRVKEMALPLGSYALFGSAPMCIRGLKDCNDADLIVRNDIWEAYKEKTDWDYKITENGVEHIESRDGYVEMWHDWRPWYKKIDQFIADAEVIDDLPFVKLTYVLEWKKKFGREKDMRDAEIIEQFIKTK